MTGWLHLGSESFRGDDEAEVSLAGSATLHGLMVGMEVRVIEDLECRRLQGGGDLEEGNGILFSRSSPSAGVHTLQSMCFWVGGGKGVGGAGKIVCLLAGRTNHAPFPGWYPQRASGAWPCWIAAVGLLLSRG